ncbi:MAG: hypothetical protein LBU65_11630 [Planctomycetaceae bacterium]|nr:hypothetical protein [Planctomycetaceae bacterium]
MQATQYTGANPRLDSIMNDVLRRQMDEIDAEALREHGAENLERAKRIQAERNSAKENELKDKK